MAWTSVRYLTSSGMPQGLPDFSVGLWRLVLRQPGQRRLLGVEGGGGGPGVGGELPPAPPRGRRGLLVAGGGGGPRGWVVVLGLAARGGGGLVGVVGVLGGVGGLALVFDVPRRYIRRTASGASSTATSSRSVCTPRMNVVSAP